MIPLPMPDGPPWPSGMEGQRENSTMQLKDYAQYQFAKDLVLPGGIPVRAGDPLGSVGSPPWLNEIWVRDSIACGNLKPPAPGPPPPAPGNAPAPVPGPASPDSGAVEGSRSEESSPSGQTEAESAAESGGESGGRKRAGRRKSS